MLRRLAMLPDVFLLAHARVAADFVRSSGWFEVGYARLEDFARERLGVSGRWLRWMAELHAVLQKFPDLVPAISGRDGDRPLGWVRALAIGRVATPETLRSWIERARADPGGRLDAVDPRECEAVETGGLSRSDSPGELPDSPLTDSAYTARSPSLEAGTTVDALDAADHDSESERVLVEDWVPPEVMLMFDQARVLHRASAGREVGLASFAEAQVGEASAGSWAPDPRIRPLRSGPDRASREHHLEQTTDRWRELRRASAAVVPTGSSPALASALAFVDRFRKLESQLQAKRADGKDANPGDGIHGPAGGEAGMTALSGSDAEAALVELVHMQNALEMRIGALLVEMEDGRAWAALGFDTLEHYAEARLGMSRTAARMRARVARGLAALPVVRQAYESGRIGLEAADWVRRWLPARDPATQEEWVAHAAENSVKRLRQESAMLRREQLLARAEFGVRCAEASRRFLLSSDPGRPRSVEANRGFPPPCDAGGTRDTDADRRFLPPGDAAGTRGTEADRCFPTSGEVRGNPGRECEAATGGSHGGAEVACDPARPAATRVVNRRFHPRSYLVPDDAAWQQSRRLAPGETQAQMFELGHALIGRLVARSPLLEVPLRLPLPRADGEALSGCVESARRELAEQAARKLTPSEEARLRPSERIARLFRGRREGVPRWVGWLAMLEEFAVVHDDPRGMPKRPTDRICIRDGWCCSAPGCTSRRGLQVHHVKYRSRLGPEEEWNEILLCIFHHLRGEHGGLAQVRGRAPLNLVWRLGRGPRSVWYRNERRLPGEPASDENLTLPPGLDAVPASVGIGAGGN